MVLVALFVNISSFVGLPIILLLDLLFFQHIWSLVIHPRTHTFFVRKRPGDVSSSARIVNYNVRGRRGNIVQAESWGAGGGWKFVILKMFWDWKRLKKIEHKDIDWLCDCVIKIVSMKWRRGKDAIQSSLWNPLGNMGSDRSTPQWSTTSFRRISPLKLETTCTSNGLAQMPMPRHFGKTCLLNKLCWFEINLRYLRNSNSYYWDLAIYHQRDSSWKFIVT